MVISDPYQNPEMVLIVNLTTVRGVPIEDLSCVLEPGEHEWITARSYVAYDMARHFTNAHLDLLNRGGRVLKECAPFPEPLLKRIRDGARVTPNLENRYVKLLQDQGLI